MLLVLVSIKRMFLIKLSRHSQGGNLLQAYHICFHSIELYFDYQYWGICMLIVKAYLNSPGLRPTKEEDEERLVISVIGVSSEMISGETAIKFGYSIDLCKVWWTIENFTKSFTTESFTELMFSLYFSRTKHHFADSMSLLWVQIEAQIDGRRRCHNLMDEISTLAGQ